MDVESIGSGAGGGLFIAILSWMGFKQRIDRIDKDIKDLRDKTVWRDTCLVTNVALTQRLDSMDKNLDKMDKKIDMLIAK